MQYRKIRSNAIGVWAALTEDGATHYIDYADGDWWWTPGDNTWGYVFEPYRRHFFYSTEDGEIGRRMILHVIQGEVNEPPLVHGVAITPAIIRLTPLKGEGIEYFEASLEGWSPFKGGRLTGAA